MEVNAQAGSQQESTAWFVRYLNGQDDWLEKARGNLVVAAIVIGAMSFELMVNPPGGFWQNDEYCGSNSDASRRVCHEAGTSILGDKVSSSSGHLLYVGMFITSCVSFSASMGLILLMVSGLGLRNRFLLAIMQMLMMGAVLCISAAFFFAIALVHPVNSVYISYIQVSYLGFWVAFTIFILLIQLLRLIHPHRRRTTPRLLPLDPSHVP